MGEINHSHFGGWEGRGMNTLGLNPPPASSTPPTTYHLLAVTSFKTFKHSIAKLVLCKRMANYNNIHLLKLLETR